MSDKDAAGTVETPTVESLQAQLKTEQEAKAKAEAKIVEMKKTTTKNNSSEDEETAKTKEILKEMWFATTEQLDDFKKFQSEMLTKEQKAEEDKKFDDFTSKFNTLSDSQKTILKDLKQIHTDKSYDEILKTTNFVSESLIAKSKETQVMGWDNIWLPQPKEKQVMNPKVAARLWLKPASELADIRSKFNI